MTTQEQVKDVVSQVLADKTDKGGIKRVVWIGAGGSNGGNYPAQYFMEHEATQVVSSSYTSNEFVHATPAYVNENTLAVVVSMRGTKETIVAAQVAKDHGASTIAIYVDESGLTEVCDYKIQYDSLAVDESCMGRTNSAVVTMIAMELTQQTEGYAEYETAMAAFDLIDPIYRKAVEYTRPLAAKWAEQNADKPCINVMAQGPLLVPPTSLASATCRRCCRSTPAPSTPATSSTAPSRSWTSAPRCSSSSASAAAAATTSAASASSTSTVASASISSTPRSSASTTSRTA